MAMISISGVWEGTYYFPNNDEEPVSFVAVLSQSGANVAGSISEPDIIGDCGTLHASLDGVVKGDSVSFMKTYDPTGTFAHSVFYDGTVNQQCTLISGLWNIDDYSGAFEMRRESFEIEIAEEESETVSVNSGCLLPPG